MNLYLYARGSPVVMVDPDGMQEISASATTIDPDKGMEIAAKVEAMNREITAAAGRAILSSLPQSRGKLHDTGVGKAVAGAYVKEQWGVNPFTIGKDLEDLGRGALFTVARAVDDPAEGAKAYGKAVAVSFASKNPLVRIGAGVVESGERLLTIANEAKSPAQRLGAVAGMVGSATNKIAQALSAGFGGRPEPKGVPLPGGGGGGPSLGGGGGGGGGGPPRLVIDAATDPNLAENVWHAQAAGHPRVLTYNGPGSPVTQANRAAATRDVPNVPGTTRDEYPFASTREGGAGSWVGHVGPPEHPQGQGTMLANFYRQSSLKAGDVFEVIVINYRRVTGGT